MPMLRWIVDAGAALRLGASFLSIAFSARSPVATLPSAPFACWHKRANRIRCDRILWKVLICCWHFAMKINAHCHNSVCMLCISSAWSMVSGKIFSAIAPINRNRLSAGNHEIYIHTHAWIVVTPTCKM